MKHIPIIRPATKTDLPAIQHIAQQSILVGTIGEYDQAQRCVWAARLADSNHWERIFSSQTLLVAEGNGVLLGFTALDGVDHVDYLYVHPDQFRRGVASHLYQAVETLAKTRGAIRLTSEVSHTARPFFERMGWQIETVQTVYIDGLALTNNRMFYHLFPIKKAAPCGK